MILLRAVFLRSWRTGLFTSLLSRCMLASRIESRLQTDAVQIDGGQATVLQCVAGPRLSQAVFQKCFKHQATKTPVPHHAVMLFEVCFFVCRKIHRLLAREAITSRQRLVKIRRPV